MKSIDDEGGFDASDDFFKSFHSQVLRGEALMHFIKSAEFRFAVAMHNVYPGFEGPTDDGQAEEDSDGG